MTNALPHVSSPPRSRVAEADALSLEMGVRDKPRVSLNSAVHAPALTPPGKKNIAHRTHTPITDWNERDEPLVYCA